LRAIKTEVILVAGGQGRRMSDPTPKAFLTLGGYPLFYHPIKTFTAMEAVAGCILVVPAGEEERATKSCEQSYSELKIKKVICGGVRRQDSVRCGMDCLDQDTEIVLIHDAARPFCSPDLIQRIITAAQNTGAAVPGIPIADTLKRADENNMVTATVDRRSLSAIQTPQGFRYSLLKEAYQNAWEKNLTATDDAGLIEHLQQPIKVVEGERNNFKITKPYDLELAEVLLKKMNVAKG
jgi:2-C-methyl-D-erythritol 4-phosphate cytidylyltransferase